MNSRNGIIGLAIGDAMGVPTKFMQREKLLDNPVFGMSDGGTFGKSKGTWSDSTALTLATMDSIINYYGISTEDIGNKLLEWMKNFKYSAEGERFDIDRTTLIALSKFEKEGLPFESGVASEDSNSNGSLKRILPIAYYCYSANMQSSDILDVVKKVSYITHAHEVSVLGCYIYVLYVVALLSGKTKYEAYQEIQKNNYNHQFSRGTLELYSRILKKNIKDVSLEEIRSTSYIVDTLEAVLWVIMNTDNFNQSIIGAINLGEDTNSIAACVGGISGILYGIKNMNPEWRIDLKRYTYIRSMSDKFDKVLSSSSKKFDIPQPIFGKEESVIKIIQGDITKLNVDAYVNAANGSLLGGDGVDGAIHVAAGEELLMKCKELGSCETGEAKITKGYKSKAKFIIHTVAPKWYEFQKENKEKVLNNCYENAISLAEDFECKRIAFPCLGMGTYGCPIEIGGKIAIDFALREARRRDSHIETIYLVCYEKNAYEYYMKYFKEKIKEQGK